MEVMFKLMMQGKKCVAKFVNYYTVPYGREVEAQERVDNIVEELRSEGCLDDICLQKLSSTLPKQILRTLPELDYVNSENPSSFILRALSRDRQRHMHGGQGGGDRKGRKGQGKGRGP